MLTLQDYLKKLDELSWDWGWGEAVSGWVHGYASGRAAAGTPMPAFTRGVYCVEGEGQYQSAGMVQDAGLVAVGPASVLAQYTPCGTCRVACEA